MTPYREPAELPEEKRYEPPGLWESGAWLFIFGLVFPMILGMVLVAVEVAMNMERGMTFEQAMQTPIGGGKR